MRCSQGRNLWIKWINRCTDIMFWKLSFQKAKEIYLSFFLSFRKSTLQMCPVHPFFSWVLHSFLDKEWHKQFSQNRKFSITNTIQKNKKHRSIQARQLPLLQSAPGSPFKLFCAELRGELANCLRAKDKKLKALNFLILWLVCYFWQLT